MTTLVRGKQRRYYDTAFSLFSKLGSGGLGYEEVVRCFERGVRLEQKLRISLEKTYTRSATDGSTWSESLATMYQLFQREPQVLLTLVSHFFRIAALSGPMSRQDEALIRMACATFRFPPTVFPRLREEFSTPPLGPALAVNRSELETRSLSKAGRAALTLLGCDENASGKQIKSAYRQLALLYHPDMYAAEGLPEGLLQDIQSRFLALKDAYQLLQQELGVE